MKLNKKQSQFIAFLCFAFGFVFSSASIAVMVGIHSLIAIPIYIGIVFGVTLLALIESCPKKEVKACFNG